MNILGISAFYHDSATCLVQDGKIIFAAQEERFTRKKHDFSFPKNAIQCCLEHRGVQGKDLDYVAFYDKPFVKFERILETYLAFAPAGFRTCSRSSGPRCPAPRTTAGSAPVRRARAAAGSHWWGPTAGGTLPRRWRQARTSRGRDRKVLLPIQ